ncbi:hypothetical protein [Microlunatus sp. Gsoil 973]|uniref:hypothetical protein n=1 Tax=Microlunatus sp. Gsoil 973 TaxID=2672569 RepID=UPI001E46C6D5|nr:hypothetical protein [Microlunatus sp. Gsoil 973]
MSPQCRTASGSRAAMDAYTWVSQVIDWELLMLMWVSLTAANRTPVPRGVTAAAGAAPTSDPSPTPAAMPPAAPSTRRREM